ncbi:hypothetical protein [Mycetocola reblochoni]|uniref:Zinc ABC transporter, inner membrane permease protein ZnuB n=2 Tax=Mycetocola reblochoni TaxID=331618 RepID=A0A1R4I9C2_9MICO|nr:hypothetical protein [Mycetocola reblochoni]RLP69183.1 hypothetical protein D9V30_07650 [Mycetocola reblochoni]SJN16398.1 Zinc ABC transporter, inner membrane permease protein ZnuB [Mycetocola reblochoni REB411]
MTRSRTLPLVLGLLTVPLLAGCSTTTGGEPSGSASSTASDAPGHGYVAGAEELSEPQTGLVTVGDGGVALTDLATEAVEDVTDGAGIASIGSDGRFVVLGRDGGTEIVDSGVWTVDHGDHQHYYRAPARSVGTLEQEVSSIASSESVVVLRSAGTGQVTLLDREALGRGEIVETGSIPGTPGEGAAYPLDGEVVVVEPVEDDSADAHLLRYGGDGTAVAEAVTCDALGVTAQTRAGIVVDCADDAIRVGEGDDGITTERVERPEGPRASAALAGRALRPVLTAPAGDAGYWQVNTRTGEWELTRTDTALGTVVGADDDAGHVLAVDTAGALHVYTDGELTATVEATAAEGALPGAPGLVVDRSRAYLLTGDGVAEIDYADDARVSREFAVAGATALVQVGA